MRRALFILALLGCDRSPAPPPTLRTDHLVDLTHTLSPRFPFIPVEGKTFPFRLAPIATLAADGVAANRWELTEHVGTHVDAPNHFAAGGAGIDRIPVRDLLVPAAVIDLRPEAARSSDAVLDVAGLEAWEARHGRIPRGAGVFLLTGWGARVATSGAFVNQDGQGVMHFPGFSPEAIAFLIRERDVRGVGTDTLSIDAGIDRRYRGHHLLLGAGRWAAECVANLDQVPPLGATVLLATTKVEGATGGPARILAFW